MAAPLPVVIDAIGEYLRTMNANHGGVFATSVKSDALLDEAHRAAKTFLQIARRLTGRPEPKKARGSFLQPLLGKLGGRRGAA